MNELTQDNVKTLRDRLDDPEGGWDLIRSSGHDFVRLSPTERRFLRDVVNEHIDVTEAISNPKWGNIREREAEA